MYRDEQQPLGDYVRDLLSMVGITKEWYMSIKAGFGLPPNCDCDARREWLNRVSDWWRGNKAKNS